MNANSDDDEYLDENLPDEQRSIFSAGWFRALVVLLGLAIVVVVSLPYVLDWMDPARKSPPPAPTSVLQPAQPPAPATPAPAPAQPETTAKASEPTATEPAVSRPEPAAAPAPPTAMPPKAAAAKKPTAKAPTSGETRPAGKAPLSAQKPKAAAPATGGYWLQVGAFRDERNAARMAEQLRAKALPAQVAPVTRGNGGATRHEVLVTGSSPEKVTAALRGSGTAQAVPGGVVVRPALELKEAVALSKRLAAEGLEVKIRRTEGSGGGAATHYLVRVGPYGDRAQAEAARKGLEEKQTASFITRGSPK
jgi:cell division protein FtsN